MKKLFRYLLYGIGAAVLFLLATVVIFIAVFDANAYKEDLSRLAREHTGRDLQFHGDIGLTLFPALGMKLGAMSFSNPPEFGARPMIKIGEASISVDMASLIAFAPEVEKLVLRDLEVNLITDKAGKTNWDDLLQAQSAAAPAADTQAGADKPAAGDFDIKGAFGGLDLQNIRLSWIDEQAGQRFEITDLDLSTGRIVPNQAFPLVTIDMQSNIEYLIAQQQLTLSDLSLALNQFQIGGQVQLSEFARPTPRLRFDLASEKLDVDALLGIQPASETDSLEPVGDGSAAPAEDVRIALPMQTLRDLDIDGKLRFDELKAQNLALADVDIKVTADGGLVALKPIRFKAYDGEVDSAVVIDVKGEVPRYGIDESASAIRVGRLLKDFTGKDSILGLLDAEANLTTSGEWLSELKRNSNGTLKLAFVDGALNGFNLRHSIDSAKAKLRGKQPPPRQDLKTDFSSLGISGVIRNGVFISDDLNLQAPLLRLGGRGQADLNDETIDYLVDAKLVGSVEGQEGGTADQLAGLSIPVSIKGPFVAPKIDVLLDEMLKAKADAEKEKLKQEIAKQKEQLRQQLEAEKRALEESRKRELEKKLEIEKARLEAEKKKRKDELKEDLLKKLQN